MAHVINGEEAFKLKVMTNLFKDTAESEKQIQIFNKVYAQPGRYKLAMGNLKNRMFKSVVDACDNNSHTPDDIIRMIGPEGKEMLAKL